MQTRAIQLLTFVLCLTLAGGAHACLCNGLQRIAAKKPNAHTCCPVHSTRAETHRCHDCDLTAAIPKAPTLTPAPELSALLPVGQTAASLATLATHSEPLNAEEIPISPHLRDLHHLFIQLTE